MRNLAAAGASSGMETGSAPGAEIATTPSGRTSSLSSRSSTSSRCGVSRPTSSARGSTDNCARGAAMMVRSPLFMARPFTVSVRP